MHPKSPKWLDDIRQACAFIQEDVADLSLEEFLTDRRVKQLVERNLGNIGVAVSRIERVDPELAERIPDRRKITGLRNRLAHGYGDEINHTIIWESIQESVPVLQRQVTALLPDFEE